MKACSSCIRAAALLEVDEVCKEIINQSKGTGQSRTAVEKDRYSTRYIVA